MTRLELTLATAPVGALDLSPLTPHALAGMTADQIRRLRLRHGTRSTPLGDLFAVNGTAGDVLALRGLTSGCLRAGAGLESGTVEVTGNPGDELGRDMRGGSIQVRGNVGDGVGLGMQGGLIRVNGSAGDRIGGMLPGATRGMNEGTIIITGDAGERVGERMRRGLIVVCGDTGGYTGDRMLAGTIIVLGACGPHAGAGMRRGSLLLSERPATMPATFNPCGAFALTFVPLLAQHLAGIDRRLARRIGDFARAERWCGDMAYGGKGEILLAAAAAGAR
ncbi:MAG: formylmethanofuran dehydrogenase subunit C [Gammaproteobacteria bacterium]